MSPISEPFNVKKHNISESDYIDYLLGNLKKYKYRPRAPIHDMMTKPNNLFKTMRDSPPDLLRKMMENVYTYGRGNWTWEGTTSGDARKCYDEASQNVVSDLPSGSMGRGLLDGLITSCACGGFAAALKGMATTIFNLKMAPSNVVGSTSINDYFITNTGSSLIDSQWKGNLWLDANVSVEHNKLANVTLGAFEFYKHYFCNYGGLVYESSPFLVETLHGS